MAVRSFSINQEKIFYRRHHICFDRTSNMETATRSIAKTDHSYRKTSKRKFSVDLTYLGREVLKEDIKNKNNIVLKTKGYSQKMLQEKFVSLPTKHILIFHIK